MELNKNDLMYFMNDNGELEHICSTYTSKVQKSKNIQDLIKLYKQEPSWAMSVKYPSLDVMKRYFDIPEVMRMGVYIDRVVDVVCDDEVYIFNNCKGKIELTFNPDKACFPTIYIGLESDLEVTVNGIYSEINVYDNSKVKVKSKGRGKSTIFRYGDGNIDLANNIYLTVKDKR